MLHYNQIYDQIKPALNQIEPLRKTALQKQKQATVIAFFIAISSFIIAIAASQQIPIILIITTLGIFVAFSIYKYYSSQAIKTFHSNFKNRIVRHIAEKIEPSTKYQPYQGIPKQTFKNTGHYRTNIDRYHSEDFFEAKIGATYINFAEIHAEYKTTTTDSNGNTTTHWHDIFKGVMFTADYHKDFNTWVTIKPDNESIPIIGWLSKTFQSMSSSNIRMEDPEFEKYFKVNAGDDQQARYLLTPDMQSRILKLRAIYGTKIILSLRNSSICITIPKNHNHFEPNIKQSTLNRLQIERITKEITYFFNIVEAMNLNTRIWTKE